MKNSTFVQNLKEASSCIKKFEAESKSLKESVAQANEKIARMDKEAEAMKLAMDLVLDDNLIDEVMNKFATLMTKDLSVVKEAMNLDLVKQASLGDVYDESEKAAATDPVKAFMAVLKGK